jgi:hypothetical protein
MKLKLLAPLAGLALATGCQSQAPYVHQHWSERSIGPRLSRAFLSYDPESDGNYRDFQWRKKQSINLTLARHFLNHNPDNPFQPEDNSFYQPRPNHSLLPRAYNYIHVEGLALGAIAYGAGGALIIPLPLDSIIGTFEEGGTEEFVNGIGETVRPLGVVTASFMHDALGLPETKGSGWRERSTDN